MLLDWHAHYPMQVVESVSPASAVERMRRVRGRDRLRDRLRALLLKLLSRLFSDKDWWSGYRITIDGVRKSDVGVLLSVLYRPFDEMDLSKRYAAPPAPGYFADLIEDLEAVEADIAARDPATIRVVHDRGELERCLTDGATALIHCVEGGFHLGDDPDRIEANCAALARRGVAYVTVAHLFFRQVATNANALPFLPDRLYDLVFPQDERQPLTPLGEALIRGLVRNRILVDLSHMAPPAIRAVLSLLDELDPGCTLPVISTHAGYRFGSQQYMHDDETLQAIARRGGVVGLIMAQHQLNDGVRRGRTSTLEQSLEVIFKHVDAIERATGGYEHIAIGTDFDGFIKPTMAGLEGSGDLGALVEALRREYGAAIAEQIASGNSLRVLRQLWPESAGAAAMTAAAPTPAADGFHHPASEQELAALVQHAYREGLQLRVRGAAHSVSHAIYTDPLDALPNRVSQETPPNGPNLNVMLDGYAGWRVRDEARKLVEADAGIHLGGDPNDPTGAATLERSLLWQLWREKGWTLSDTGGIAHQTVSGFIGTGSSGGSLQRSANRNLWGFRLIDGRGEVHEVTREDADPNLFDAMCPNVGLLGVVSTITFQCVDAFDIVGQEATTTIDDCPVDVFGPGKPGRPSLAQFLREVPFARLEWWPQRGVERMVTWQADEIASQPGFEPRPYRRFGDVDPEVAQHLFGIVFTIIGNLGDLSAAKAKLDASFDELQHVLELLGDKDLGELGRLLGDILAQAIEVGVDAAITLLEAAAPLMRRELPAFYPKLVDAFVSLDKDRTGSDRGPQRFQDWSWHGLPMDNAANDVVLPTEFTEAWVPLARSRQVMGLLRDYFAEPHDDHEALQRTGTYAWELYAAMPERFWINAAHSSGEDEWRDGALRIDAYWFAGNAADPTQTLYLGFWNLLRDAGIPFRLHWGKLQPSYEPGDRMWVDFFRAQYPRWDDFLRLRAERDPNNVFLTDYWRNRFGLWDEPRPAQSGSLSRLRQR